MFCSNCGTQIEYDARFCPECGSSVGGEYSEPPAGAQQYGEPPAQAPYYAAQEAPQYGAQQADTQYYAAPSAETSTYGAPSAEIPYYPEPPSDATVFVQQPAEPMYTPPPPPYDPNMPSYAPNAPPPYAPPQTPPESAGGKKNLLKIIIPVGAVVLLLAAFACIYFFTDILPFGPNHVSQPKKTETVEEPEPEPTPRPTQAPTPPPVPLSEMIPSSGGEVRIKGDTELKFRPDNTGLWELRTSDNGGADPYLEIYSPGGDKIAEDDDGGGGLDALIATQLDEGSEYTVKVGFFEDDGSAECLLTVTYSSSAYTYDTIPGSGGQLRVDDFKELLFTPDKSGYWEFRTSENNGSDTVLSIYDIEYNYIDGDVGGAGSGNALLSVDLDAGKSYNVMAGFIGDTGTFLLTVTHVAEAPVELPSTDWIGGDGGEFRVTGPTTFAFTPGATGIWEIRTFDNVDSDPYLTLYNSDGDVVSEDDDLAGDGNALLTVLIQEGESYVISATFFGDSGGSYKLRVAQCVSIPNSGGTTRVTKASVLLFVPEQSGTWELRTSNNGDSDPIVKIYDIQGNFVAEDDDGGGDSNALITTELKDDMMYLLYMSFYNDDGTGSFDLTVTKK